MRHQHRKTSTITTSICGKIQGHFCTKVNFVKLVHFGLWSISYTVLFWSMRVRDYLIHHQFTNLDKIIGFELNRLVPIRVCYRMNMVNVFVPDYVTVYLRNRLFINKRSICTSTLLSKSQFLSDGFINSHHDIIINEFQ